MEAHKSRKTAVERLKELGDSYGILLGKKPELWMFVPCDEEGNVLEKPKLMCDESGKEFIEKALNKKDAQTVRDRSIQYQQALSRVIFEGFEVVYVDGNYAIIKSEEFRFIWKNGSIHYYQEPITRIEDLPDTIVFKEGVV